MNNRIKILIWILIFLIGILISYLRIGKFQNFSFSISMGGVFTVLCAIPTFISSGVHYYISNKKTLSHDQILDEETKGGKNYWDLFYNHLSVASILVAIWKYFRPLMDYEISGF